MFTLEYAKDPVYNNEEGTAIFLIVKWEEFSEEMPFGACSYDPEFHGRDLFERAKIGEFGPVAPYVAPIIPVVTFEPTPTVSENKL